MRKVYPRGYSTVPTVAHGGDEDHMEYCATIQEIALGGDIPIWPLAPLISQRPKRKYKQPARPHEVVIQETWELCEYKNKQSKRKTTPKRRKRQT